jgi:hypothetical protein
MSSMNFATSFDVTVATGRTSIHLVNLSTATRCHTRFYKENRMHLICAPGSIYTHMIDKMRVIPLL